MIAAQCWCDEETSENVMDPKLAEAFAIRLAAWMETAAQTRGMQSIIGGYWCGVVKQ